MKKRLVSIVLLLAIAASLTGTVFANQNTENHYSTSILNEGISNDVIASETAQIPVRISLSEMSQLQPQLEKYGISYTIGEDRAIAYVNVSTRIHYDRSLYFSVIAQCPSVLLQRITGIIKWKYKRPTMSSFSAPVTISVNYQDDFGIPKYTLTCIMYTYRQYVSGTQISADFNIDIDATNEVSGGAVSRTVTAVIP